jgi:hypothetical protein
MIRFYDEINKDLIENANDQDIINYIKRLVNFKDGLLTIEFEQDE